MASKWLVITLGVLGCSGSAAVEPQQVMDADGSSALLVPSSRTEGHRHVFRLALEDLGSPPADGLSDDTSVSEGHKHRVLLTADELRRIGSGEQIKVLTSMDREHRHELTLTRAP